MKAPEGQPSWQVKSVVKAIQILSCFTPEHPELSLADISSQLKIPKSTTLNLLRTLEDYDYISRTYPSMNYRLGYAVMQLNYCKQMSMPVVRLSLPFLEDLQFKTGKTIYLTTHINGKVLYLDVFLFYQRQDAAHALHRMWKGNVSISSGRRSALYHSNIRSPGFYSQYHYI